MRLFSSTNMHFLLSYSRFIFPLTSVLANYLKGDRIDFLMNQECCSIVILLNINGKCLCNKLEFVSDHEIFILYNEFIKTKRTRVMIVVNDIYRTRTLLIDRRTNRVNS